MAETPCGSVHESPMRHLPHAPKRKARKTKFRAWDPLANFGLRVKDSNLKR